MVNSYETSSQIARHWGVTERYVQLLCKNGRIDGAVKFGNTWAIPRGTNKLSSKKSIAGQIFVEQSEEHEGK